jgi:hypothetical protein
MLSLEQCRKLCPSLVGLSEEEVVKIRDNLYEGAQLALESWAKKKSGSKNLEWLLPKNTESII